MPSTSEGNNRTPGRPDVPACRVAILTPSFPPKAGGIATAQYNVFRLLERAYDVRAFVYGEAEDSDQSAVVKRAPSRWLSPLFQAGMRAFLRRVDRTAVPTNCLAVARAGAAMLRLNGPLRRFRPHVILAPDNMVPSYFLRKPHGARLLWCAHNNYRRFRDNPLISQYSWADLDVAFSLERHAARKADAVICPSRYMADVFAATHTCDLPKVVIHNIILEKEWDKIQPAPLRQMLELGPDVPIVYLPSAGTENKGKRYTLELVRRLTDRARGNVAFYLSGPLPADLAFELKAMGARKRLAAPGQVSWAENVAYVKACDVAVSPTLVENFSNALLEAMTLGKPCVTFDVGGNRELIEDGVSGFLAEYLDVDALVDRANRLLSSLDTRREISARASAAAQRIGDANMILEQYREILSPAVFERSAPVS